MGLKSFKITQGRLSTSKHCRLDRKYCAFTNINDWIVFDSDYEQLKLSEYIEKLPIIKYKKGELDDEYFLVNISDQEQRSGVLTGTETTNEIGSDKNYLGNADIFVSKLGMPKGYIFLNPLKGKQVLGSTELIPYRIKESDVKLLIKYFLLHPKMLEAYSFLESGKTPSHRRVNPYEFLKIRIPFLPEKTQLNLVSNIETIEKEIYRLKQNIKPSQEIINRVFAREFSIDLEKIKKTEKIKQFIVSSAFSFRNPNLRSSARWHKIAPIQEVMYENVNCIEKLGDCITSTKNGWSPSCRESDSENLVFGVNCISKSGVINYEDMKVSDQTRVNIETYFAQENDLFVSRGNTTDLVALASVVEDLPDERNIIYPDLFIRVDVDEERVSKKYLAYLFNSIIGRSYFKYSAKGKNQTMVKISSDELNGFFLPLPSLAMQQKITNEIKTELDAQEKNTQKIEAERIKIDEIIERAMKNS